jgi:exodeoxyribonuclease VIII
MKSPKGYLSYSQLKAFAKSPNHYLAYINQELESTPAMELGTLVHKLVLEPREFDAAYYVAEKVDKRTNEGKAKFAAQMEEAGERKLIDSETYAKARTIAIKVLDYPEAWNLIELAKTEVEKVADINGHPFKTIADGVSDTLVKYVFDLKTCKDASPEEFRKTAYNLDYHLQAAIYKWHHGVENFYWIAVETEAPFNVSVFRQSDFAGEWAAQRLLSLLEKWEAWDGEPSGYSNHCINLELPQWVR